MDAPRLTVIIEWENVLLSEVGRAKTMLRNLVTQIRELRAATPGERDQAFFPAAHTAGPFEILILYNSEVIDGHLVESIVTALVPQSDPDFELRIMPAPGLHYYELKTFGARQAKGDLILFLDSDVIPQDGWLASLAGSLADPEIHVVGGDSCIDPQDLVGKTFSLFWFFDRPGMPGRLYKKQQFWANNVIFRKDTFLRFPFPVLKDGVNRGSCNELSYVLQDHGIQVYRNSNARVSHPAPNGFRHIVTRAVAEGRDRVFQIYSDPRSLSRLESVRQLGTRLRSLRAIVDERRKVGIKVWQLPIALGIGATYHLLQFYGEIMTRAYPEMMRRRFQI